MNNLESERCEWCVTVQSVRKNVGDKLLRNYDGGRHHQQWKEACYRLLGQFTWLQFLVSCIFNFICDDRKEWLKSWSGVWFHTVVKPEH